MSVLHAFLLGVVEGVTEFLPISSTGHLILFSNLFGVVQNDAYIVFEIAIQLGAILAVCALYWRSLLNVRKMFLVGVGFIPTGIIGLLAAPFIKPLLTSEHVVIWTMIVGGVVILLTEGWYADRVVLQEGDGAPEDTERAPLRTKIGIPEALMLGLAQTVAIVPGVSRSGAVMVTGLWMRLSREVASEFAFLLAVPTMLAATAYTTLKHRDILTLDVLNVTLVGFITAAVVAFIVVKEFLGFIRTKSFVPFGWYRIILGLVTLLVLWLM